MLGPRRLLLATRHFVPQLPLFRALKAPFGLYTVDFENSEGDGFYSIVRSLIMAKELVRM